MLPGYGRFGGGLGISGSDGSWNPGQISNIVIWLDADPAYVTKDGSNNVSQWNSRVGTYFCTAALSPTWSASGINSKPTITCGTTSSLMGTHTETGTGLSAFFIGNMSSGSSSFGRLLSLANTGISSDWNQVANCQMGRDDVSSSIGCSRGSMGAIATSAVGYDTTFMAGIRFDGTNGKFRVNGSAIGSSASSGSFNINRLAIFRNVLGGDTGAGACCEVVVTTGDISDSDAQKLEGYWAHRYGCTSVLPGGHPYKTVAP